MQQKAFAGISTAVILVIGIVIGCFVQSSNQGSTTKKVSISVSPAEIRLTVSEPSQIARKSWPTTLVQGSEFDDVYAMPLRVTSPLPFTKPPSAPIK